MLGTLQEKSSRFATMLVNDFLYYVDELFKGLQDGYDVKQLKDSGEFARLDADARAEKEETEKRVRCRAVRIGLYVNCVRGYG